MMTTMTITMTKHRRLKSKQFSHRWIPVAQSSHENEAGG